MASNEVIAAFKAESLLEGSHLFSIIDTLRDSLRYSTDGELVSYDNYMLQLQDMVDGIKKLSIDNDVPPGTENQYTMQLITTMEQVYDESDRVSRRLNHFEAKLKDVEKQINKIKTEFTSWYILSATAILSGLDIKFPPAQIKELAASEFSRLMQNLDVTVDSLLTQVKTETSKVSQHKATQKEKYTLGKDQVNASWSSALPGFGNSLAPSRSDQLTEEQEPEEEEADVPAFVSKKPMVALTPEEIYKRVNSNNSTPVSRVLEAAKPGDTVVIRMVENVAPVIQAVKDKLVTPLPPTVEDWEDESPAPSDAEAVAAISSSKPAAEDWEDETEIKGVFVKTGDPKPVIAVVDDEEPKQAVPAVVTAPTTNRKRLIFDEDVI